MMHGRVRRAAISGTSPLRRPRDCIVQALAVLLILLAGTPSLHAQPAPGGLRGEVRSQETGQALAGALIELAAGPVRSITVSDARGQYEFVDVPAGRSRLHARYLGHGPLVVQVSIPPGERVTVDLSLALRPVVLDAVGVDASAIHLVSDSLRARSEDLGMAGTHALSGSPGLSEIGIGDAVRGVPDDPGDPGSVLYVRGATADLKLVYLDGAPVYAPFPLGGLLDPFTPGVLGRADVYLGGAPARYDGGLSYVMDLRSRASAGPGLRAEGALDLLSARALVDGGFGDRVSVLATARGIHPGASSAFLGEELPYGYMEGFARADVRLGSATTLNASGFRNRERIGMGSAIERDSTIEWGNAAGSVQLRTVLGSTIAEATAAIGEYDAWLPLMDERSLTAHGRSRRSRFAVDFTRPGPVAFRYGLSVDRQRYGAFTRLPEMETATAASYGSGTVAGGYAELSGMMGERLRLRGGIRADHFSTGSQMALAPRFAATWLITDRAALTLAAGVYHQFLRPPDETLLEAHANPLPLTAASAMTVGSASHVAVGLDQDLGDGVRLGVEGFYKNFSDVPGSLAFGANASGVDLWVRRSGERWDGWLGYSLAWAWSTMPTTSYTEFTGRHLLSSGIATRLGAGTYVDFRFAYGAGLPYSAIRLEPGAEMPNRNPSNYTAINAPDLMAADRGGTETAPLLHAPDRPFLRIDLGISQLWTPTVRGRNFEIEPYLKLLNGLGRRDALFYYSENGSGSERPLGSLPVLPVAGLKWRF